MEELGIFWVYTTNKKWREALQCRRFTATQFQDMHGLHQKLKGCNVQISFSSRCHKPLNNSPWCDRGLLLIHSFLNSWQPHQQSHCHSEIAQVQAQMQFYKKHPHLFAFWAKQFLIRICCFIYFKILSILRLLPVTQGDYMMAWSPWKQWTNLRCFHCCR